MFRYVQGSNLELISDIPSSPACAAPLGLVQTWGLPQNRQANGEGHFISRAKFGG